MNPAFRPRLLAALAAAFLLTPSARADTPAPPAESAPESVPAQAGKDAVSLDEIRRFVSVFRAVKEGYVDPIDDQTLMRAAIRGLLIDLDPHSAYLDAEQSRALSEAASGAYDGLGLEVIQQPDRSLLVIAPIDDTPAARAGIRPGDVITEIDGIRYINSGDWVESCTAIAEHHDGEMELITWQKLASTPAEVIPVSRQMPAIEAREPEAA